MLIIIIPKALNLAAGGGGAAGGAQRAARLPSRPAPRDGPLRPRPAAVAGAGALHPPPQARARRATQAGSEGAPPDPPLGLDMAVKQSLIDAH
eukprot:3174209-Pyramimonas_sp.AAC.2